jgi:hypothetical protein
MTIHWVEAECAGGLSGFASRKRRKGWLRQEEEGRSHISAQPSSTEKCKMKKMRALRTITEGHKPVSQSVGKL